MHLLYGTPTLGLTYIRPSIFKDFRGEYTETYNQQEILPGITFVQDSVIHSTKWVLRGYHGDDRTTKLITCLHGAFQITVVCIDPVDEEHYLKSETMILDDKEKLSLVVPPRYVNAHQCLTDDCLFFYKQDTFYRGQNYQYTIRWDSFPDTVWPHMPIISQRDKFNAKYYYEYLEKGRKHLLPPEEVNK